MNWVFVYAMFIALCLIYIVAAQSSYAVPGESIIDPFTQSIF